jgi:selenide,water dikinase
VIVQVMQGASDVVAKAQANFVGGHSIDDDTLKFGLSVTGFVHPEKIWSNAKAQAGDVLILTKALGTGTMTAALKRQEASEADILEATQSMSQLNNIIDFLSEDSVAAIHAATDITGFGLSGHSMQLAKASHVRLHMDFARVPRFARSLEFLEKGFLTKAHRSNALYTEDAVDQRSLSALQKFLIHDPQTSGGLLLSVKKDKAAQILQQLQGTFAQSSLIGRVLSVEDSSSDFMVIFE